MNGGLVVRNFARVRRDNLEVKCADCREALSARLDGEEEPVPATVVDQHLLGCPDCLDWQRAAATMTRAIRVRPAVTTPDLTEQIIAAARPPRPVGRRSEFLRWALGAVAFIQLTLALAQLLGVDHTSHLAAGAGEHLFNESSAWNLGVAIGLLVAATRPALARGLVPALAVFVVLLVAVSVADVLSGDVGLDRLGSHVMVVIGLALLVLVDRQYRRNPLPGMTAAVPVNSFRSMHTEQDADENNADDQGRTNRPGRWLRPAGRHVA